MAEGGDGAGDSVLPVVDLDVAAEDGSSAFGNLAGEGRTQAADRRQRGDAKEDADE